MYKELVISIIIVIFIFALDHISQEYTDLSINEAIQDLYSIKESIKDKNVENSNITQNVNEKYEKWLEHHKRLAFYIEHNELEKVETSYIGGKSYIELQKYEEAISELDKTIFILGHIHDKYSIKWDNIF